MHLIKLGGSVITDKMRELTFRDGVVKRLAREIAPFSPVIIVHGAGSFGHIYAKKYGLNSGYSGREQLPGFVRVQYDVRRLNLMVMDALISAGINAISIPPSGICINSDGKLESMETGTFRKSVETGLVPVTFGDAVFDNTRGFSICSGDYLMERLAEEFRPEKTIFVTDVDGIYDKDPEDEDAKLLRVVSGKDMDLAEKMTSKADDVTGGMAGKMTTMLKTAPHSETWVINGLVEGRLANLLKGEEVVGSKVIP